MAYTSEEKLIVDGVGKYSKQLLAQYNSDLRENEYSLLSIFNKLIDSLSVRVKAQTKVEYIFSSPFQKILQEESKKDTLSLNSQIYFANLCYAVSQIELESIIKPSYFQKKEIGKRLFKAGKIYMKMKLYEHALSCFDISDSLFKDLNLSAMAEKSSFNISRSNHLKSQKGLKKIYGQLLYIFSGYGFMPMRLLYLGIVIILIFSFIYQALNSSLSYSDSFFLSASAYFSLFGYGDAIKLDELAKIVILIQNFISLIINTSFLALLARKWFKI